MDNTKILIVDDNSDLADGLAMVLSGDGYEAVVAYSGEEAIAFIDKLVFQVAILDVKLPGIDGLEVLDVIKRTQPRMHVVMMTAQPLGETYLDALDKGAVTNIRKPFDIEKLLATIDALEDSAFIMVVDDDSDFCASVEDVLRGFHYNVAVIHNGRDAIEHIISHRTDVLILDLKMPVKSGLELYRDIERCGRSVPTIVVTGYPVEEAPSIEILKSKSVTDYLIKPFDPSELVTCIKTVLERNAQPTL